MGLDREAQRAQEPTCKGVPHECDPFHDAEQARRRARVQYGLIYGKRITHNDKKASKCITEMTNCKVWSLHSVIPNVMAKVSAFCVFLQFYGLWHNIETSV